MIECRLRRQKTSLSRLHVRALLGVVDPRKNISGVHM
ncbi:hypothetical protein KL86PLE_41367 [uncultured Pleomorphomonas sp.]|uniref:Uncharacterized protein n=1 Tax=uncultured Pleomorphomonas sp. TaxID=442121 RepID=A0A212LJ42_9HYPH|nr:hypothetical protein KL86PLE_41367 [uncultured Pleomorphomonas sp.]